MTPLRNLCSLLVCLFVLNPSSRAAVILMYHHVDDSTPAATSISPALFAQHLEWIADSGLPVLPLETLLEKSRSGEVEGIAITFDDGYISVYEKAFPLLKARAWPFTVFVNPARVGHSPLYADWPQLAQMRDAGALIANHTHNHPHLIALDKTQIRREIEQAQQAIQNNLGNAPRLLAYPYGEYSHSVLDAVESMGFSALAQHSGAVGPDTLLSAVPRFPMSDRYGQEASFKLKIRTRPLPWQLPPQDTLWNDTSPPRLVFELPAHIKELNCFADGQGQIPVINEGRQWTAQAPSLPPLRRFKYTCTSPDGKGRFYWSSRLWIQSNISEQ